MCGFAGFLGFDWAADKTIVHTTLATMTDRIAHRGPDGEGVWIDRDAGVALGHRRLSIIDLSPAGAPADACRRAAAT